MLVDRLHLLQLRVLQSMQARVRVALMVKLLRNLQQRDSKVQLHQVLLLLALPQVFRQPQTKPNYFGL